MEKYSKEWFIKQSQEARETLKQLAKLYPGCFTKDGRPIVAVLRFPRLGDKNRDQ